MLRMLNYLSLALVACSISPAAHAGQKGREEERPGEAGHRRLYFRQTDRGKT